MSHTEITTIRQSRWRKIVFWVLMGIIAALFFTALFAVAVTFLWNWLMTDLFGLKPINYFQAFGLVLLARLLVGGWHHGHKDNRRGSMSRFFGNRKESQLEGSEYQVEAFSEFWSEKGRNAFENYLKSRRGEPG